jgi:hypothetical protein
MNQDSVILNLFDIDRNEIFFAHNNNVLLYVKGEQFPRGEVYYKNNHFGVRFGDYKPSTVAKYLD